LDTCLDTLNNFPASATWNQRTCGFSLR